MSVSITSKTNTRREARIPQLCDLSMDYEGSTEEINVRPPDLSPRGMFVNTDKYLPDGAVLNLKFRLARTQVLIEARCEVRYCLKGVGVGVEFIGLPKDSERAIHDEIAAQAKE